MNELQKYLFDDNVQAAVLEADAREQNDHNRSLQSDLEYLEYKYNNENAITLED